MYPIIGIPCRADSRNIYPTQSQNEAYLQAVIQAGGVPLLIPLGLDEKRLEIIFNRLDGLLFAGGSDIDPAFYQEPPRGAKLTTIQRERDQVEIRLMQLAMNRDKPFLAICRGAQIMNVAAGGSLWQDVESQRADTMRHDYFYQTDRNFPRNYIAHAVNLDEDSLVGQILGRHRLAVNSLHHQAAKEIGPGLRPTAYADDGVVEALEAPGHPFGLGVQWHPEELVEEHETARRLFWAFIEASRNGTG